MRTSSRLAPRNTRRPRRAALGTEPRERGDCSTGAWRGVFSGSCWARRPTPEETTEERLSARSRVDRNDVARFALGGCLLALDPAPYRQDLALLGGRGVGRQIEDAEPRLGRLHIDIGIGHTAEELDVQ